MAKNICPRCKEVVLIFGYESMIMCTKCEMVFEVRDENEEPVDLDD